MNETAKFYKDITERNNAVGKGFCVLKWWHLEMHLGTGNYHSCFHCPQQNLKLDEDMHNTLHKVQQKVSVLLWKSYTFHRVRLEQQRGKPPATQAEVKKGQQQQQAKGTSEAATPKRMTPPAVCAGGST